MTRKKMTKEELQSWENLYYYVKDNLMGYDSNQALSSTMVLRLKGLLTNKFMENKKTKDTANYSYETILNTFKFCSPELQRALRNNNFRDEQHKFNYILKIVEQNINNVYLRMKRAEKAKEELESVDTSQTTNYVNTFKKKERKINKRLNELW